MALGNSNPLLALNQLFAQQISLLKTFVGLVTQIAKPVKGGPGAAPGPGGAFSNFTAVFRKFAAALELVNVVVGTVIAVFSAVPRAILGIVSASESFVRALNPYLVEQYEREQQNLSATIGFALTPVIQYATKSLREWAGILLPSIQQLRPLVESLSAALSGALLGSVRALAAWLDVVVKLFAPLTRQMESVLESATAIQEVTAAVYNVLFALVGELGDVIVEFATAFAISLRYATVAAGALVAQFLALIGATKGLRVYREHLQKAVEDRKNPKPGLLAAPTDAGSGSIEDIARKMSERAFIATAGTGDPKKNETDLLEDILGKVIEIEKQPIKELRETITQGVKDGMLAIGTAPGKAIIGATHSLRDASSGLWDEVKDVFRRGRTRLNQTTVLGGG